MATVKFEIKNEDLQKIQEAILDYGNNAERDINDYLHSVAKNKFIESITNYIPVSNVPKAHAKMSNPLGSESYNLSIVIKTKPKFNYLYFPQTGEGTSKKNAPNDFMQKGIDEEYNNVINDLLDKLNFNK